jgi:hypothetical protein
MLSLDQLAWVLPMILINPYSNCKIIDNNIKLQRFRSEPVQPLSSDGSMIPASANIMEEKSITGAATGQKTLVMCILGHNVSILQGEQLGLIIALILSENASPTYQYE